MERKDKNYFLFAVDTVDQQRLIDFNFIDIWVNTACNRISDRKRDFVEIDDIFSMYSKQKLNNTFLYIIFFISL